MQELREPGRRERKRVETARAIHVAAAELVLESGFEATTIDAISERADVSPRTFFNYYPSKEDAVLGVDEAAVSAALDVEREYTGDPIASVFELIFALFEASGGHNLKSNLKRRVLAKHPELLSRQMVRIADLEDRMAAKIADWFEHDEKFANESYALRLDDARVVLSICLATVRTRIKKRSLENEASDGASPAASVDSRLTHDETLAQLRTVLEKLA